MMRVGVVDDMVIREDEARRIDDESGTRAAPRRVGLLPLRPLEQVGASGSSDDGDARRPSPLVRRRVDVDDGRVEPFCDIGERDGSGGRDAEVLTSRRGATTARRRGAACRRCGSRRHRAGHDETDEKRDRGRQGRYVTARNRRVMALLL